MTDGAGLRANIDLEALRDNVRLLARIAAPAEVMLAVKANAYGHGVLEIARAGLEAGATELAVLDIPTGLALRAAGLSAPMFAWLHGVESDFPAAVGSRIDLGVSARWQLERIASAADTPAAAGRIGSVHLKLDTGLSRNGATIEEWPSLVDRAVELARAGRIRLRAAWSHLADASVADDEDALAVFREGLRIAREHGADFELLHLAASSAGIRMPEARFDRVRFGIAAYGISPFDDRNGRELGLRAPMTFESVVVGFDVAPEGAVLARVAGGYGDGINVAAESRAEVLIAGRRHRVVQIGVDEVVVELSGAGRFVEPGDRVVFFGPGDGGEPTAEDWAGWAETIGDEIVVRIPAHVPRHYVG